MKKKGEILTKFECKLVFLLLISLLIINHGISRDDYQFCHVITGCVKTLKILNPILKDAEPGFG